MDWLDENWTKSARMPRKGAASPWMARTMDWLNESVQKVPDSQGKGVASPWMVRTLDWLDEKGGIWLLKLARKDVAAFA